MKNNIIFLTCVIILTLVNSGCNVKNCEKMQFGRNVQNVDPSESVPSDKPMEGNIGKGPKTIISITNLENEAMKLTYKPISADAITDEIPAGGTSFRFAGAFANGLVSIERNQAFITERGDGADIQICFSNPGEDTPPEAPDSNSKCVESNTYKETNKAAMDIVNIPEAWNIMEGKWQVKSPNTTGWPSVLVIDDGFFYHTDLLVRPNLSKGFNRTTSEGRESPLPAFGAHGTAVASIIGAVRCNDQGIDGVAGPRRDSNGELTEGCNWIPALAEGWVPGAEGMLPQNVAAAINHYISLTALRVINISQSVITGSRNDALAAAFQKAEDKGILIIIGAGNDAVNRTERGVNNWLAEFDNIITVGGLNQAGTDLWKKSGTEGSAFGTAVDIYAPAEDWKVIITSSRMDRVSGTSFATPVVSGVAAMMLNIKPGLSAVQLKAKLIQSAQSLSLSNGQTLLRLDAEEALKAAMRP